jgi:site-specific DNA-methyltransferase (adenine-specific)
MRLYYEDRWVKIIHGNCREILPTLDIKVDLVLTDPPYEQDNHGGGVSDLAQRKLNKAYIDFVSDSFDMEPIFTNFERISKSINFVIFCSNKQVSSIMRYWEDKGYSVTLLVWDKPNPIPFGNGKYISNIEFMVYIRGTNSPYNNIGYNEQLKTFRYGVPSTKQRLHPTEKPIALIERLIRIHSNENNLILDPFLGSGTTCLASKNLGRQSLGIEIEEKFCEIAAKRCSQEVMELSV